MPHRVWNDSFGDHFMNTRFVKAALVGTVAFAALGSTGAQAATATANAKAKILAQITVTRNADLDFATIVPTSVASTVTVTPAGARTCGVGLVCLGTAAASDFGVTGTTGQVVTVSVPTTVSLTGPGAAMSASLVASASTITLAALNTFQVGGTLSVGANQLEGSYVTAAPFTVTVNYQ